MQSVIPHPLKFIGHRNLLEGPGYVGIGDSGWLKSLQSDGNGISVKNVDINSQ